MGRYYTKEDLVEVSRLEPPTVANLVYPLQQFISALQKECPHFRFGVRVAGVNRVWVYAEDETYARGWIGYQNYNDTGGEEKFGVRSKQIINEKYGAHSYQHHLRASKILKNAVKFAKGFLDRVTTAHVHEAYRYTVDKSIDSKAYEFTSGVANAVRELGLMSGNSSQGVMRELIALYDSGYEFLDNDLPTKIRAVKDAQGEKIDNAANKQAVLVWKDGSKVRTTTVNVAQVRPTNFGFDAQVYATPEMLPVEIRNKISILQVAEDNTYLMDTGMRLGEDIFYVQV